MRRAGKSHERKPISGTKFLMMLLVLGVAAGTLIAGNLSEGQSGTLSFIAQGFVESRANQTFLQTFTASFFSASIFLMAAFFMGFCAISQPLEILLPMFKGIGLGVSMARIYLEYGGKGALICLLMVLPAAIACSFVIIIASREAIKMSGTFLNALKVSDSEQSGRDIIKKYLLKFTVLIIASVFCALLDALLTWIFAGMLL